MFPYIIYSYQNECSFNLILQNPLRTVCSEGTFDTIRDNVYFDTVLLADILITASFFRIWYIIENLHQ